MSDLLVVGISTIALSLCVGGIFIPRYREQRIQQERELELAIYLDDIQTIA
jgi:hypothetical protein